jgi:hypothetical protein
MQVNSGSSFHNDRNRATPAPQLRIYGQVRTKDPISLIVVGNRHYRKVFQPEISCDNAIHRQLVRET